MLILPTDLGFLPKFKDWRANQLRGIEDGLSSPKRFVGQVQLPGKGKTLVYMAQAVMARARTMILTGTKGLQTQLLDDFANIGLTDIRGKANYDCVDLPGRNCEDGSIGKCNYAKGPNCTWARARECALQARYVTSNYACWTATNKYGRGFGTFDHLILDEAHNAPDILNSAMSVTLSEKEVTQDLQLKWPDYHLRDNIENWMEWAFVARRRADYQALMYKEKMEKMVGAKRPTQELIRDFQRVTNLSRKLSDIVICSPSNWVPDVWHAGYRFDPIYTSSYGERILFNGIPKVTFISGTIKRRTLEACGIPLEEMDFFDYPEELDVSRSPLMFIPTAWVNKDWDENELRKVVARIDEIIESRCDRRIIVHTVSNRMRDYVMSKSKYSRFMLSNYARMGDVTAEVIKAFKAKKPPVILVSASVTTGYDFPMDDCRVQIIAKLPYPDTFSSKVERARSEEDPKRGIYQMWVTLAQMFKRADRSSKDFQEVFILDNNIEREMTMNADLAPSWLPVYYRKVFELPVAPYLG